MGRRARPCRYVRGARPERARAHRRLPVRSPRCLCRGRPSPTRDLSPGGLDSGGDTMTATALPHDVAALIGAVQYEEEAEFPVERGYIWTICSSVENGNPLFWDDAVAEEVTGGPVAPPSMLSTWFRPHHWAPGRHAQALPLPVHFDMK